MSISISVSQHHHSPISSTPFVMLPISIMEQEDLSRGSKYLYVCLKRHARQKGFCWPSICLICREMQASPNTIRKYTRELVAAGLVTIRRRGQGRSNVYTLHPENSVRDAKNALPEAQNLRIEEDEKEKEEGGRNVEISRASPSDVLSLDTNPVITEEPQISSPPSSPVSAPLIDEARMAIFPYVKDIGREMHDEASLTSTVTRTVRIFHRSGVSLEAFQMHLLLARQKTQERSASIKKVGADGMKNKVPYWFKVLETSLGLVELPQSSHFSSSPYPRSQSGTAYFTANHTNPMVQGTRDFWNDRE